jgi:hypothetical protein
LLVVFIENLVAGLLSSAQVWALLYLSDADSKVNMITIKGGFIEAYLLLPG